MLHRVKLSNLKIVPEEMIIACASKFPPDQENSFKTLLNSAHEFKLAGLTPVYLCNSSFKTMIATTQEKLNKELH
jgi:hypothetical protein